MLSTFFSPILPSAFQMEFTLIYPDQSRYAHRGALSATLAIKFTYHICYGLWAVIIEGHVSYGTQTRERLATIALPLSYTSMVSITARATQKPPIILQQSKFLMNLGSSFMTQSSDCFNDFVCVYFAYLSCNHLTYIGSSALNEYL